MTDHWQPDVLGEPFESLTLPLADDDEGAVVTTLVRRLAPGPGAARGAVLHVHGFADYFFQTGLAQWWVERGWDFYAVDLRKYGRSWLPHQTPTYVTDLATYDEDLDAVVDAIGPDRPLVLSAHSTGGLVVPLWWQRRADLPVAGCVLNSPWLELRGPAWQRGVGTQVIDVVGRLDPMRALEREVSGHYARSLHRDHDGEWDFDLRWKPEESFATRFGWLRAIRRGHAELHRGLDLPAPVLVLGSDRTGSDREGGPEVFETDVVLDVEQIRRWTPALGRRVTLAQVPGAMHDVYLSRQPARDRVYDELGRWVAAYVEA